jgi:hypothetical protein
MPQVIVCISAILRAIDTFGEKNFEESFPAMTAWVLGRRKSTPSPTGKEAIQWLERNSERIKKLKVGKKKCDIKIVEDLSLETDIEKTFETLLENLDNGVDPKVLLNHFSFSSAKKFNNLSLNNGGLWNSASEGFRLCFAIRGMLKYTDDKFLIHSLFTLTASTFKNRWLKGGRSWDQDVKKGNFEKFKKSFNTGEERVARTEAINYLNTRNKSKSLDEVISVLMVENQSAMQLNTLVAAVEEGMALKSLNTYISGYITYAADMKQSQHKKSAADFGVSYMKNKV